MILISSHFGYPLSSTHVISGGVIGAGAARRLSAVRWGVAGTIALAWAVTLPSAALFGAAAYAVASAFGHGAWAPCSSCSCGRRPRLDDARDPPSSVDGGRERLRCGSQTGVSRRSASSRAGCPA